MKWVIFKSCKTIWNIQVDGVSGDKIRYSEQDVQMCLVMVIYGSSAKKVKEFRIHCAIDHYVAI